MKSLLRHLVAFSGTRIVFFILSLSFSSIALASFKDSCLLEPYLGVDAGFRRMFWKPGYGDNVFKHTAWQPNAYVGLKFGSYFGIELGYEDAISKKRDGVVAANQRNEDIVILNTIFGDIVSFNSKVKLKGWHFNAIGTYPLDCWDCVELLGTVGLASLKTTQKTNIVGDNGGLLNPPPLTVTFSKKKIVPRFSTGIQYKFAENFKLRLVLLGIENTSLLGDLGPSLELPNDTFRTKMKHNTYHSIGIIYNF